MLKFRRAGNRLGKKKDGTDRLNQSGRRLPRITVERYRLLSHLRAFSSRNQQNKYQRLLGLIQLPSNFESNHECRISVSYKEVGSILCVVPGEFANQWPVSGQRRVDHEAGN